MAEIIFDILHNILGRLKSLNTASLWCILETARRLLFTRFHRDVKVELSIEVSFGPARGSISKTRPMRSRESSNHIVAFSIVALCHLVFMHALLPDFYRSFSIQLPTDTFLISNIRTPLNIPTLVRLFGPGAIQW